MWRSYKSVEIFNSAASLRLTDIGKQISFLAGKGGAHPGKLES